jgi:hypothetical protein
MGCKSYGDSATMDGDLRKALLQAYQAHSAAGNPSPTIRELLENKVPTAFRARQQEFIFSADEVLDEAVTSETNLSEKYEQIASKFADASRPVATSCCLKYNSGTGRAEGSVLELSERKTAAPMPRPVLGKRLNGQGLNGDRAHRAAETDALI